MGIHSGRFAAVNGVSTLTQWTITEQEAGTNYVASNTAGGQAQNKGPKEWTGSYQVKGIIPPAMPGETFSFAGYTAPADDVEDSNGAIYSGTAIVDSVSVVWNWETGEAIALTVNFSGDGELACASGAAIGDETAPANYPALGCIITVDSEELPATTATLTITSANQAYNDASTGLWKRRKAGAPISWTFAVTLHAESRLALPCNIGDDVEIQSFVNGTQYWGLKWGHCQNISGITFDRTSGAIVSATLNFVGQAVKDGALGQILKPGASQYWPIGA